MTSYNREKFIQESIESVLAQTYTDFELIIVDDNSSDRTQEIILSYANLSKIRYYFNSFNLGEYQNRNKAASLARGKYIKYLDSDDLMSSDCLEVMVHQMDKFPNAAIGLISYFNQNLHITNELMCPADLYKEFYFKGNLVNCGPSSTIIRTDVFCRVDGYKLEPFLSDTDFILRITSEFDAVVLPKRLIFWRQHPDQEYNYGIQSGVYKQKSFFYFKKYLENSSNPMNSSDTQMALRNLKNRYSRNILLSLFTFNYKAALTDISLYQLNFFDLFYSFLPNRYPKN